MSGDAERIDLNHDGLSPEFDEGLPEPCPNCGGPGYLESIDVAGGWKHESCHTCRLHWSTSLGRVTSARSTHAGRSTRTGLGDRLNGASVFAHPR